jgi:hypothetical protein
VYKEAVKSNKMQKRFFPAVVPKSGIPTTTVSRQAKTPTVVEKLFYIALDEWGGIREMEMSTVHPSCPASSKPRWRQAAYYACCICSCKSDYITPRGLFMLCWECKTRYINVFGEKSLELKMRPQQQ